MTELSIIIPCYKKGGVIKKDLIEKSKVLKSLNISYEMLVIVDGDVDSTVEIIEELISDEEILNIKLFNYSKNRGKGYAVREGFKNASGRFIAYVDADLDIDPIIMKTLYNKIKLNNLDFAYANKFHKKSVYNSTNKRQIGSKIFRLLVGILFNLGIEDTQTGAKIFTKKCIDSILSELKIDSFAFDIEIICEAFKNSFKKNDSVPVLIRSNSLSTMSIRKEIETAVDLFRIRF